MSDAVISVRREVTRTSWALNATSRTLRAEIDLTNTESPKPYLDSGEHQLDPADGRRAKHCWTYSETCRFCGHPTAFSGKTAWRPDVEDTHA